jgi:RNA polymerase sigma-70 factor, ECF subfamily
VTAVIHQPPGSDTTDVPVARDRLSRLADEDLMPLVAATDADALEVIYDRHCAAVYSLAYRIVGRRAAADDVCQEAFMTVWRSGGRYDPALGSVRGWLLTIAHHRAIDVIRRATRRDQRHVFDERAGDLVAADDDTERTALQAIESRDIRVLLAALPSAQRRVIELAFYSGFSHVEIAAALDLPLGTVKGRMRLGLLKLREQLTGAQA